MWDLLSAAACDAADTARNAGVHVLVTASEREVASPNKANADRFAANVLPVIEQIKASGATSLRAIAKALNARGVAHGSRRHLEASAGDRCAAAGVLS